MNTEHHHEILTETLTRLKNALNNRHYDTLQNDFKPENLLCFKQANPNLLNELLSIAHQLVAHTLTKPTTGWHYDLSEPYQLHPVYGALIHTLFQDSIHNTKLQVNFYQTAGDNYYNAHKLHEALPYYTRAYELQKHLPQSHKKNPDVCNTLSKRLAQLELGWHTDMYFLRLKTSKLEISIELIQEGLSLANQLLIAEFSPHCTMQFYETFSSTLETYLNSLNTTLQKLYIKSGYEPLENMMNNTLWPIIKILSSHHHHLKNDTSYLTQLIELGYRLIPNLINNAISNNTEQQTLSLLLNKKKNNFSQHTKLQSLNLPQTTLVGPTLRTTLSKATHCLTESARSQTHSFKYKKIQAAPHRQTNNAFTQEHLSSYTNTLKGHVLNPLCAVIQRWLGPPPCEFTLIAAGSLARAEAMLSSDLDLAILLNPSTKDPNKIKHIRQAPYFKNLLSALDQGLQLITGRWQVSNQPIEHSNQSPLLRQDKLYFQIANGLRVDPMDNDFIDSALPPLVQTPTTLAQWVLQPLQTPATSNQNDKTKILRHSLLQTTFLYASHPSTKNLHTLYQQALRQILNQTTPTPSHFLFGTATHEIMYWHHRWWAYRQNDLRRLQHSCEKGAQLTVDQSILWVKECLRVLADWTTGLTVLQQALLHASETTVSQSSYQLAPYWIKSCQAARLCLLHLKCLLENPETCGKELLNTQWLDVAAAFKWVLAPILTQFKHYKNNFCNRQDNKLSHSTPKLQCYPLSPLEPFYNDQTLDPLACYWFAHLKRDKNPSLQASQSSHHNLMALIKWLHHHHATLNDYRRFYRCYSLQSTSHQNSKDTSRRQFIQFVKTLQPNAFLLHQSLLNIPNSAGFRLSEFEAYQQLTQAIEALKQPAHSQSLSDESSCLADFTTSTSNTTTLKATLKFVSQPTQTQVNLTLHPDVVVTLLDKQGELRPSVNQDEAPTVAQSLTQFFRKQPQNPQAIKSRHVVARLRHRGFDLHLKAFPDLPAMDYAVDIFNRRLMGHGSRANTLGMLTVDTPKGEKRVPLLISTTAIGDNLKTVLAQTQRTQTFFKNLDKEKLAELFLLECLKPPGDGFSRNYIVVKQLNHQGKMRDIPVCIDNDQMFVVPMVYGGMMNRTRILQVRSILSCLPMFATLAFPQAVLKRFVHLDINNVLDNWLKDSAQYVQHYLALFTPDEQKLFFEKDKNQRQTPRLLLRQGLIAELAMQTRYVQRLAKTWLNDSQPHTARELLHYLNTRLAALYDTTHQKHPDNPEKMFAALTHSTESRTSSQALVASGLRQLATLDELEKATHLTPEAARAEIKLMHFHFTQMLQQEGIQVDSSPDSEPVHLTVDFKALPNNEKQHIAEHTRQHEILKVLMDTEWSYHTLSLAGCAILDDKLLTSLLSNSYTTLGVLNLSHCTQITGQTPRYLSAYFPHIKHLRLSYTGIINFCSLYVRGPLIFPSLQTCHLAGSARVKNHQVIQRLTQFYLEAPQLTTLKLNNNPTLHTVTINAPRITKLNLNGALKLHTLILKDNPPLVSLNLTQCAILSEEQFHWNSDTVQQLKLDGCHQFAHTDFRAAYPMLFTALKWPLYSKSFVNQLDTYLQSQFDTHHIPRAACPQLLQRAIAHQVRQWSNTTQTIITTLLSVLKNNNLWLQEAAANALGDCAKHLRPFINEVIPALLAALKDNDSDVQRAAANALENYAKYHPEVIPQIIPALLDALKDNNSWSVRYTAAKALENCAQHLKSFINEVTLVLLVTLKDNNYNVREAATEALGNYAKHHPEVLSQIIPTLLDVLKHDYSNVRKTTTRALENCAQHHPQTLIPTLLDNLKDNNYDIRKAAAYALGNCTTHLELFIKKAIPSLLATLKDKNSDVRKAAAYALGNCTKHHPEVGPQITPALLAVLKDKNYSVRKAAAKALGNCTKHPPQTLTPALLDTLKDKNYDVRKTTTKALENFTKHHPKVLPQIIPALLDNLKNDSSWHVREAATNALGKCIKHLELLIKKVILALLAALKDKNYSVRKAVAKALENCVKYHPEVLSQVISALLAALKNNYSNVRKAAAKALGNCAQHHPEVHPQAIPALSAALKNDDSRLVRKAAAYALGNCAKHHPQMLIPTLLTALKNNCSNVRKAVAKALGNCAQHLKLFIKKVIPALLATLKDKNYGVRKTAAKALLNCAKHHPQKLIPVLLDALKDKNYNIRKNAIKALGNCAQNHPEVFPQIISVLLDTLKNNGSWKIQATAAKAFKNHVQHPKPFKPFINRVIPALLDALKDKNSDVRRNAADALRNCITHYPEVLPQIIPTLLAILKENNSDIRKTTTKALRNCAQHLKPFINDIIPALLDALKDNDDYVKGAAATVLSKTASFSILKTTLEHLFENYNDEANDTYTNSQSQSEPIEATALYQNIVTSSLTQSPTTQPLEDNTVNFESSVQQPKNNSKHDVFMENQHEKTI